MAKSAAPRRGRNVPKRGKAAPTKSAARKRRSKHGFSFSWKRAIGWTARKQRFSRKLGIPLTKQGRQRKVGRWILRIFGL